MTLVNQKDERSDTAKIGGVGRDEDSESIGIEYQPVRTVCLAGHGGSVTTRMREDVGTGAHTRAQPVEAIRTWYVGRMEKTCRVSLERVK